MKPTRATQPYRAGARDPGPALDAMTRGRTLGGMNPMDFKRAAMLTRAGRSSRVARPERPKRAPRPQR